MRQIVVDTSVSTGWFHPAQATEYSAAVLGQIESGTIWVPPLWLTETFNTFLQSGASQENQPRAARRDSWKSRIASAQAL